MARARGLAKQEAQLLAGELAKTREEAQAAAAEQTGDAVADVRDNFKYLGQMSAYQFLYSVSVTYEDGTLSKGSAPCGRYGWRSSSSVPWSYPTPL